MNKKEFLDELENALSGRLPESDIGEITSDYGDIFDNSVKNGRTEAEIAKEIGSPAKIARTILEDGMDAGNRSSGNSFNFEHKGGREYTDFQKNINEKTSKIFDKVIEPDRNVAIDQLASMARRLGAYVIDSLLLGVFVMGGFFALFAPFVFMTRASSVEVYNMPINMGNVAIESTMAHMGPIGSGIAIGNLFMVFLAFGAFNLFTTLILWATNGYTPGKWILGIRVVKINGAKISFLDALLRELVIKCIANSILSGVLNIISFVWGCVTDDHKTVHDMAAQTQVIKWVRTKKNSEKSSNPLES